MGSVSAKTTPNTLSIYVALTVTILAACILVLATTVEPAEAAFPGANGKIAFAKENAQDCYYGYCSYEIYTINANGTTIAFESDRDGNRNVYSMNADGTNETRLTEDLATDGDPVFSPSGTRIAFESYRKGKAELYKMNVDGTEETRLTRSLAHDVYPDWQPLP
jgi:dipeptidyl aminopeptidase/acylaminoacyl peptidase